MVIESAQHRDISRKDIVIGVVGYGRFGRLWGKKITDAGYPICIYDPFLSNASIEEKGVQVISHPSEFSRVHNLYILFLCTPISQLRDAIHTIHPFIPPQCLVCDTSSVKVLPMKWMKKSLGDTHAILGTHPLFGPDSASLASHNTMILCDDYHIPHEYGDLINTLLITLNITVHRMSAEEHDTQAVYSQGLTHLVGRVLQKMHLKKEQVTTKGYESLLEIINQTCNDSEALFYDIQTFNTKSPSMWNNLQKALEETLFSLNNTIEKDDDMKGQAK